MAPIERFEDILAWQVGRLMSQEFMRTTSKSRSFTNLNLLDQMSRSSESVTANIAEGFDCRSDREFVRYLNMSTRSASEFQSHLYLAFDKAQIDRRAFDTLYALAGRTKSLIGGFRRYLLKCLEAKSKSKAGRTRITHKRRATRGSPKSKKAVTSSRRSADRT
jgi:four helix bundle protein